MAPADARARQFSGDQPFDLVAHDIGIWNTYPMLVEHQDSIRRVVYMEAPVPDGSIDTFPALAIGGGGHGGLGQFQADQMRRYADNVQGKVLPGCGHWLPEECATALNSAVTAFLDAR